MDNNWDKNSLESTESHLLDEYLSSLMDLYLAHFRRRGNAENASKLILWVRSTVQRDAFAMSMIRARLADKVFSASEISEDINVSRQAVYQMIKDCTPEGWIRIHCEGEEIDLADMDTSKGILKYSAGDEMLQIGRDFVKRHIIKTDETFLNSKWDDLMAFQRVKAKLMG